MKSGCYTALVTPFIDGKIDMQGLEKLVEFQIRSNIDGILGVGTTGESPCLDIDEREKVVEKIINTAAGRCICIANAGTNDTKDAMLGVKNGLKLGADALLMVDPYYNGPSSLEIRKEYLEPAAKKAPNTTIIPYIIPGRTGTQLLPQDLAILYEQYKNINTVKEATGNLENMRLTRQLCGPDFTIFSGDDDLTFDIMLDPQIRADGVISVYSNIFPKALSDMVKHIKSGEVKEAEKIKKVLSPLLSFVNVAVSEDTKYGNAVWKFRNPVPIKTFMALLGMPSGPCRQPLGKMTKKALDIIVKAALQIHASDQEIFAPIAEFFNVDIKERLTNSALWKGLYYE